MAFDSRPAGDYRSMTVIPLWLKLSYSAFLAVLVPAYWLEYGPVNFLWACDIALFLTAWALWRASSVVASIAALATLLPDVAWNADYFARLLTGRDLLGLGATGYMFDAEIPLAVRALSLFHVFLPVLLLWLVYRLGYARRALVATTLLCWLVLPLSYVVSDPSQNVNWVHGFGSPPQPLFPGFGQVAALMLAVPLGVYLPTHLLLRRLSKA